MAGDVGSSMGIGGSGGSFSRKTELVADLNSAFKSLNSTLKETERLTAKIAGNIKGSGIGGKGGGADLGLGLGNSSGTKTVTETSSMSGGGQSMGGNLLSALGNLLKTGLFSTMQAAPTIANAFEANTLQSSYAFSGGAGGLGGFDKTARALATGGTSLDPSGMDSLRAAMAGSMSGAGPAGASYGGFIKSIQAMSNVSPFISQEAHAAAFLSMQSPSNVNMAKMIGINMRDSKTGGMRSTVDIVNDLWSWMQTNKKSPGPITQADLDLGLQPGGSLDSVLNQYFSGTPELRVDIVRMIRQKATGKGFGKADVLKTGAQTSAQASQGKVASSATDYVLSAQKYEMEGFKAANTAISALNTKFAELARNSGAFQKLLESKGFIDTFSQGMNGAGGAMMTGLGAFGGSLLGNLFGKGGGVGKIGSWLKNAGGKIGSLGSKAWNGLKTGGKAVWGAVKGGASKIAGVADEAGMWTQEALPFIETGAEIVGEEALSGVAEVGTAGVATPIEIATQALVAKQIWDLTHKKKKPGGKGGGTDNGTVIPTRTKPLSGNPQITSPYGEIRYLNTSQGHNATYGKPHKGVDFEATEGTPVYAVTDGKIIPTSFDATGYGNWAKISGVDGFDTIYGHLTSLAAQGDVKAGQLIGYSGNTGNSTGPHLHFQVEQGGTPTDPLNYLNGAGNASGSVSPLKPSLSIAKGPGYLALQAGGEGNVPASDLSFSSKHDSHGPINYGGVTINISVPSGTPIDAKAIAQEVKQSLQEDSIRMKAVAF